MSEWRQIAKQEVALLPRTGWAGAWDALKSAVTGAPRKTVPTDVAISIWVKSDAEIDVKLTGLRLEQSARQ